MGKPAGRRAPRFFLAHPKSWGVSELEKGVKEARMLLESVAQGKAFVLILGRDYFEQRFKAAGSWPAWALEVAQGTDSLGNQIFDGILIPSSQGGGVVGHATAAIVKNAIAARKPVWEYWDGTWAQVVDIEFLGSEAGMLDSWGLVRREKGE